MCSLSGAWKTGVDPDPGSFCWPWGPRPPAAFPNHSRLSGPSLTLPSRSLSTLHSDHDEPDFSNSKSRARSCCPRNDSSSNSNPHDLIHARFLGIESFVSAPRPRIVVISRKQSHQKYPSTQFYSNSLRMPRRLGVYALTSTPHSDTRTQYYSQFQHSHYPQASYGHYQPYIPPAQTAQAQTAGPMAAALQRQAAQATSQLDTADVATLNDAIGSAGVDLRVRAPPHRPPLSRSRYCHRQKKRRYSAAMTNIKRIAHMKTARESSP